MWIPAVHGVKAKVKTATGEQVLEADILLSAIGIAANIEGIGLETLGVKTDKGKIVVDKFYNTNVAGLYSIRRLRTRVRHWPMWLPKKRLFVWKISRSRKKNMRMLLNPLIIIMYRDVLIAP